MISISKFSLLAFEFQAFSFLMVPSTQAPTIMSEVLINVIALMLNNNTSSRTVFTCTLTSSAMNQKREVQRAGFEPANPYGKGWLIEAFKPTKPILSPSPLTWLGYRCPT